MFLRDQKNAIDQSMVVELSVALAVRLSSLDQCCDLRIFLSVLIDKLLGMFFYISP